MSDAEFRETARRELSAAMAAAGLSGLAMAGPEPDPVSPAPKVGPRPNKFAGMEIAAVDEVDVSKSDVTAPVKEAVNEAKAEEAQDKLDLGSMQQDDLVALADNWGVPLPEGADAAQIRGLLAEYL